MSETIHSVIRPLDRSCFVMKKSGSRYIQGCRHNGCAPPILGGAPQESLRNSAKFQDLGNTKGKGPVINYGEGELQNGRGRVLPLQKGGRGQKKLGSC